MKEATVKRINEMNDFQVIRLYESFSQSIFSNLQLNLNELLSQIPSDLEESAQIKSWIQLPPEIVQQELTSNEAATFARTTLLQLANHSATSEAVDEFLENYQDNEQAVGTLLVLGGVISMIMLVATSKFEMKDGKTEISIGGNRNPAELKALGDMIAKILGSIPDNIFKMLKGK